MAASTTSGSVLKYATTFKERLLDSACEVEVVVNIASGEASVVASAKQLFGSNPSFRVSLADLEAFAACVRDATESARFLDELVTDGIDHQLNSSIGQMDLIVVKPADKPARYTLSIGLFHREGLLSELGRDEIDKAIGRLQKLRDRVVAKVQK